MRIIAIKKRAGEIMHGAFDDESKRTQAGITASLSVDILALCEIHKNHHTGIVILMPSKKDESIRFDGPTGKVRYVRHGLEFHENLKHFLSKKTCSTCVRIMDRIITLGISEETAAKYLKMRIPLRDWEKIKDVPFEWTEVIYAKQA